ncbi:uncharacterized protein BYT42DRAFT_591461 [Radiomyces spectabilis]|uniref:uncharacterized protein n=1 Tax=Radiomyces spectabilis TaxID=64574 RepID=UPI00221F60D8|nr:uncharacterized protein BYT42DRAFT_591461 [Radiomyces spectabilis]KAI8393929.1 hypothetical protein BYT42DRAFT_591461 [Radiomyces spectabilis]
MASQVPWDHDTQLTMAELLKQSMSSAGDILSDDALHENVSTHFTTLLQHHQGHPRQAVGILNKLFSAADERMECDTDKQVLSLLQTFVSGFIATALGSPELLPSCKHGISREEKEEEKKADEDDNEPRKVSWAAVAALKQKHQKVNGEANSYTGGGAPATRPHPRGWFRHSTVVEEDDDRQERREHERMRQQELSYHNQDNDNDNDRCDQEPGTRAVNRYPKQHSNGNGPKYYRHQRIYPQHFRPEYLADIPGDAFCMPLFFPSEHSYQIFINALASARESLLVCVYSLTDNTTADALIDAYNRGVDVRIITDNDQLENKGADVLRLHRQNGIPFKTDDSEQFMHNKFAVVDHEIVITGSFNWSIGARFKNRENIVITNLPSVVRSFDKEFEHLWQVL